MLRACNAVISCASACLHRHPGCVLRHWHASRTVQPAVAAGVGRTRFAPAAVYSTAPSSTDREGGSNGREMITFASWQLYRKSTALAVKVIKPSFKPAGSGMVMDRAGVMLLEFASAVPNTERTYNWEQKLTFSLSAVELHDILANPEGPHSIYHDPDKGSPSEGSVKKSLSFRRGQQSGYFIGVAVTDRAGQRNIQHNMSEGEFGAFSELVRYLTPRLLGFHKVFE